MLFSKYKIYIKTLKTLQHISIIRSSSGSTRRSLLKLLYYNFSYTIILAGNKLFSLRMIV